jgi:hypothetical protein
MQAIVKDRYGPPDVLAPREIAEPVVGDHDVLVRMHAAGLDQGVWHVMAGLPTGAVPWASDRERPRSAFAGWMSRGARRGGRRARDQALRQPGVTAGNPIPLRDA